MKEEFDFKKFEEEAIERLKQGCKGNFAGNCKKTASDCNKSATSFQKTSLTLKQTLQ